MGVGGEELFTGIVEELGKVTGVEQDDAVVRLTVRGPVAVTGTADGDSIAVNGVCLTVVAVHDSEFTVDVVHETVRRSSLAGLGRGDRVNLERATALGQRLGGHIMQGHVDGTAELLGPGDGGLTWFALPEGLERYVVEKGSVALDGASLTVAATAGESFAVALIPATLELTTLGLRRRGDGVNVEVDVLAKYVEKLAGPHLVRLPGDNGGTTQEER